VDIDITTFRHHVQCRCVRPIIQLLPSQAGQKTKQKNNLAPLRLLFSFSKFQSPEPCSSKCNFSSVVSCGLSCSTFLIVNLLGTALAYFLVFCCNKVPEAKCLTK
jgi:hypothetical protein